MYAAKRCELGMVVTIFDPHGLRQGEPILTTTPVPTAKPGVIHSGYGFCKIEDKRPVAEKPPGRPATVPLRLGRPAE